MKITYLAYKEQADGSCHLSVITDAEWREIVRNNKTVSKDKYRYFESDVIVEGNEIDMMIIEVSREEHKRINAEKKAAGRRREQAKHFQMLSLETERESEDRSLPGFSNYIGQASFEDEIDSSLNIELLRKALNAWKPWASEMLNYYLAGQERHCAGLMAKKYGLTGRQIRYYRLQFENFLKKFYS